MRWRGREKRAIVLTAPQQRPDDARIFTRQCDRRHVSSAPKSELTRPRDTLVAFAHRATQGSARTVDQDGTQVTIPALVKYSALPTAATTAVATSGPTPAILASR